MLRVQHVLQSPPPSSSFSQASRPAGSSALSCPQLGGHWLQVPWLDPGRGLAPCRHHIFLGPSPAYLHPSSPFGLCCPSLPSHSEYAQGLVPGVSGVGTEGEQSRELSSQSTLPQPRLGHTSSGYFLRAYVCSAPCRTRIPQRAGHGVLATSEPTV